jgi:hypothetical protein
MQSAESYEDVKARVQKADLIIFTIHGMDEMNRFDHTYLHPAAIRRICLRAKVF